MAEPLLELHALDVHYGAIHALRGISILVGQGEIVSLIGANGAGKTTTLRAVSGMLRPSAGQIRYEGAPIAGLKPHRLVARGLCHAPEGRGIFPNLTVRENLLLGAFLRRDAQGIARDMQKGFKLFPILEERAAQMAGTLSGGEQQMLSIARALMSRPRLLLLDEPSLGLAPIIVSEIFGIVRELNHEGMTVVVVEQNAHIALQLAHTAFVLEVGRVALAGPSADLQEHESVRRSYLGY